MLATVWLGTKFRFDALGRGAVLGQTVTKPPAEGAVSVTFNTIVATPDAGTKPRPATSRSVVASAPIAPPPAARPSIVVVPGRVSRSRAGTSGWSPALSANQPTMSTSRCVLPLSL